MPAFHAAMHFVLRLEAAQSLKEKRFVVKSVKERLRQRFNVSLAEVGEHDSWRLAELAVVTVARSWSDVKAGYR